MPHSKKRNPRPLINTKRKTLRKRRKKRMMMGSPLSKITPKGSNQTKIREDTKTKTGRINNKTRESNKFKWSRPKVTLKLNQRRIKPDKTTIKLTSLKSSNVISETRL